MLRLAACLALLSCSTQRSVAPAPTLPGDAQVWPVSVGDGPLLFFHAPLCPPNFEWDRIERLYVVDVEAGGPAQLVMRGTSTDAFVLERIDETTVLIRARPGGLQLLDIATGARRALLPNTDQEFLAVVGDRIYFLEHRASRKGGKSLDSETDRGMVVRSYDRPESYLYCHESGASEDPRLLWSEPIEHVLAMHHDAFWVVKKGDPCELWKLPTDHALAPEKLIELDPTWITSNIHPSFSPTGRFLALGLALDHHYFTRRDLAVIDLSNEAALTLFEDVGGGWWYPPGVASTPQLEPYWVSDHQLVCHGLEHVMYDVASGGASRQVEVDTSQVQPGRAKDPHQERLRLGMFELNTVALFALAESSDDRRSIETLTSLNGLFMWSVSPDGRWAAHAEDDHPEHALVLVDALTATPRFLVDEWSHSLTWLPETRAHREAVGVESEEELHAALGRRVTLDGIAKHGRDGPVLVTDMGTRIYLPHLHAHRAGELGQRVTLAGRLGLWYSPDPMRKQGYERFEGVYVLTELEPR